MIFSKNNCDTMKIAVTGGKGFIGNHLITQLLNEDYEVISLDKSANQGYLADVEYLKCDITNSNQVNSLTKDADVIIHLAALSSIKDSTDNLVQYNRVNVEGTINVLEAAKKNSIEKVIFTSTSVVYGKGNGLRQKEDSILNPSNFYGLTKLSAEYYCSFYADNFGLNTVSLRPFNVYGPMQKIDAGVIPVFINSALTQKKVPLYGSGKQKRDFIYVKDLVNCYIKAIKSSKKITGKSINVGSGENYSVLEILKKIESISGKKVFVEKNNSIAGDVKDSLADISLAKELLDWEPTYSLEQGLKETFEWYASNK